MKSAFICATLAVILCQAVASPLVPQSRVVGGKEAPVGVAPFIVSLQWVNEDRRQHFCAGAIIDGEWVLTAAHCIRAIPRESLMKVVAGRHNLHEVSEEEQIRMVEEIIIHQNFTGGISADDLALLRLEEPFEINEAVQPIALARSRAMLRGSVTMYGWGSVSRDFMPEFPDTLQMAETEAIDYKTCEDILGGPGATPLKPSNVCTSAGTVSACNGDSGGPLVKFDEEEVPTLVGVISWGFYPCGGASSPSIYVNVASYNDWIQKNIE